MLDKAKIYIVDFDDSFTFNIAAELYYLEKSIVVVSHRDFFSKNYFSKFMLINTKIAVILGPGPGSPYEHNEYFSQIDDIKLKENIFLMGICLGHQMLALIDGLSIRASNKPTHGGQMKINFESKNILVQRYNSLAVYDSKKSLTEIQIRQWDRGVSYQFHPESIGTDNRPLFFKDLLNFINSDSHF